MHGHINMLLKLPIILSSNSFKIIPGVMHPTISLIYIAMVKLQYILLIHEAQKDLWFFQLAKGSYFQRITLLWIRVILYCGLQFV